MLKRIIFALLETAAVGAATFAALKAADAITGSATTIEEYVLCLLFYVIFELKSSNHENEETE